MTAAPCTPPLPPLAAEAAPPAAPPRARSPAPGIEPAPAPPLRANPPDPSAPPPPSAATAPAVPRHRSGSDPPAGGARISARAGIALNGQAVCRTAAGYVDRGYVDRLAPSGRSDRSTQRHDLKCPRRGGPPRAADLRLHALVEVTSASARVIRERAELRQAGSCNRLKFFGSRHADSAYSDGADPLPPMLRHQRGLPW
jgi:hypothetical protein